MSIPKIPKKTGSAYIVGPIYDGVFFIGAPILALGLGLAISLLQGDPGTPRETDAVARWSDGFIGAFIFAHLGLVLFRSHGNPAIFARHRWRFTLVPAALLAAMLLSTWVAVCVSVLATWWDVYHSGMQTFGLGRIYDAKRGNDRAVGRGLDLGLNQLLYAGPILAGVSLWDHINDFKEFEAVGATSLASIPYWSMEMAPALQVVVVAIGAPYLAYYIWRYDQLARHGYKVSPQKVVLYAATGLCSLWSWGFNTFGEAFFIMNFFHALQYFALVWWSEGENLTQRARLAARPWGRWVVLAGFLGCGALYGVWAELWATSQLSYSVVMVIAIMHFWYDGFIWSVRRRQV